ncbi:uncharacterized protein LOC121729438 [Aricia agestis]|uniref:uncharacterized protein LOC121729438 n=1 Tax=Aricia agestis TaxID=91739 RepID=UPI001C20498D|nr:uncharacterized protein LOC121729438 [Aricia agestis]
MLSNINEGDWGVKINPSARKSIHAGCSTCIENKIMGRYGCSHRKEKQINTGQSQGTDEVDNVMSKLAPPYNSSRPLPTRKSVSRRNSIDVPGANNSDETDDDNELYRSAAQSDFNTSRDEFLTSTNNSPTQDRDTHRRDIHTRSSPKNGSYISGNTLESYNISPAHNISRKDISDYETRYDTRSSQNGYMSGIILESARINSAHNLNTRRESDSETTRGGNKFKYVGLILVLAVVAIGINIDYFLRTIDTENDIFSNDIIFHDHISSLGAKYKVSRDAILRLKVGISTISKNQDAASFMLIYDSRAESFNAQVLFSFVEELALKTVQYLRNNSNSIQNVIVDTDHIETESELRALQSEVEKTGVMIVPNINDVPSELAMAFHYYCDEYNPLVKSSAIFFTLDAAACIYSKEVTHTFIEKCLLNKWNDIHKDKIGPLLTRVVNVIIDISNITLL